MGAKSKFIGASSKIYSLEYKDIFALLGLANVLVFVIMAEDVGKLVVTLKVPVPETIAVCIPVSG